MGGPARTVDLFGRDALVARLAMITGRAENDQSSCALLAGPAGIGKTALARTAAATAAEHGVEVGWGIAVPGGGAPAYWPCSQALNAIARATGLPAARSAAGEDLDLVASIVTALGSTGRDRRPSGSAEGATQITLLDATSRWVGAVAAETPLLIMVDDLQWADASSLSLLTFLVAARVPGVVVVIAYRDDELTEPVREAVGLLLRDADHLRIGGLDPAATGLLIERVVGTAVDDGLAADVHRRSGGHPFFVRELALLHDRKVLPDAVRDVIERRLAVLPPHTVRVLQAAAVAGTQIMPDVIAATLGLTSVEVVAAARPAVAAGMLTATDAEHVRFVHDLTRETLLARLPVADLIATHQAVGSALEARAERAGDVAPAELARHFVAALPLDGLDRAVRWARAAATADRAALAFPEAAAHMQRLRLAAADAAQTIPPDLMVDLLLDEADALARAGDPAAARPVLRHARAVAADGGEPRGVARVALATAELGSTFAARRDEVVADLESALLLATDHDLDAEARLSAALARELQHSVAEQRPRAEPLSRHALTIGRHADDPQTLLSCLLARHDVLWRPGTADQRAEVAAEIVEVATRAGDGEHRAQGLLLLANAEIERGSAGFRAALDSCLQELDRLGQPRHRYLAETRRAALALLTDRLEEAERRIDAAVALGTRISEPDTQNVAMSQRLELVRARGRPDELVTFADQAVAHWVGAPVHAHAVAAGFTARAGELDRARTHIAAVVDLGGWSIERSYLWSVLTRELGVAAVAVADVDLCRRLLDELAPLADGCAVNGAVVAFAGSHGQTVGLLAAFLGRTDAGIGYDAAEAAYRRLGAAGWLRDLDRDRGLTDEGARCGDDQPGIWRVGGVWHLRYAGREIALADAKGLRDLARLLARPGTEFSSLDLMESADRSQSNESMGDATALRSYRRRLADLEAEADEADRAHDLAAATRIGDEREALRSELGKITDLAGRPRSFANRPAERARKAVTARIRASIAQIAQALPELGEHLDRTVVTGTYCRYRGERSWATRPADG